MPVALAYCTLCGSGILFETTVPTRKELSVFGSSGFLYRSNKLMFDRTTHSLWDHFTGQPVSGSMTGRDLALVPRLVVIDTWAKWRAANPETKTLSMETGHERDCVSDVVYNDYFASRDLMFPVDVDHSKIAQKDYVTGIRQFGDAKAWSVEAFREMPVINDEILGRPIVLIGDAQTRAVLAYERGAHHFAGGASDIKSGEDVSRAMT